MTDVFSFCANVTTIHDMVCRSMEPPNELVHVYVGSQFEAAAT